MREWIKSMFSLAWGMSLATAKQMQDLLSPRGPDAVVRESETAMGAAAKSVSESLSPGFQQAYRFGEQFQRRAFDAGFGMMGQDAVNPMRFAEMGMQAMRGAADMMTGTAAGAADRDKGASPADMFNPARFMTMGMDMMRQGAGMFAGGGEGPEPMRQAGAGQKPTGWGPPPPPPS